MAGTPLREIFARFGFEFDKKAFKNADKGLTNLKSKLVSVARFVVAGAAARAISRVASETAKLGDSIDKTSSKLGINAQALQELRFAGELTGVAVKSMDMSLQRFTRNAADAAEKGTGPAAESFQQLGIRVKDAEGNIRPIADLMGDVAEGFKNTEDSAKRVQLAFDLFGREGVSMVNTLSGGRDALEEMREEARLLGGVMDEKLIKASVEFTDTQLRMQKVFRGIKNVIAGELLPAMIESMKGTIAWVKENRKLISMGLQRFFRSLFSVIKTVSRVVAAIIKGVATLLNVFSPLNKSIIIAVVLFGALALAMGFPILVGAALLLVIDDIVAFFDGRKSVTGGIVDAVKEMIDLLVNSPVNPDDIWFVRAIQTMLQWVDIVSDKIADFFLSLTSLPDKIRSTFGPLASAFGVFPAQAGALPGGATSATIPGGGGGGTMNSSPTINQTINAPAGVSPQEIGAEATKQMMEAQRRENRKTLNAMVAQ